MECFLGTLHLPPWSNNWPVEIQLFLFLRNELKAIHTQKTWNFSMNSEKRLFHILKYMREHHPMRYNRLTEVLKTVSSVKLSTAFLLKSYFLKRPLERFKLFMWVTKMCITAMSMTWIMSHDITYFQFETIKDNVIFIIRFQYFRYGLCCICTGKSIWYLYAVSRRCLVGCCNIDQPWVWRVYSKERFHHFFWSMVTPWWCMSHIIWWLMRVD